MNTTGKASLGFTLTEVMVTSALSVIVLAGVSAAFIQEMKLWEQEQIKNELNYNLEMSLERIRQDMRLSSVGVGQMAFYPQGTGNYTAISIPGSLDTDGDGLLQRDTNTDAIVWNQTIVYHVRPGTPDQLLRTTFFPRCPTATADMIYNQLSNVAASVSDAGVTNAAMVGESCTMKVVFENLVNLRFRPPASSYDCYQATSNSPTTYNWGSLILSNTSYGVNLSVVGKNNLSTGHKIIVDKLSLSASQSEREGESYYPSNHHPNAPNFVYTTSNGAVSAQELSTVSPLYSGYAALIFTPTAAAGGTGITFTVYNDLLHDTEFMTPGCDSSSNCTDKIDTNFIGNAWFADNPPGIPDKVISMDKGTAWTADYGATEVTNPPAYYMDSWALFSITNVIYGGTNNPDMKITKNGCWARFFFQKGGPTMAFFMTNVAVVNPVNGSTAPVTFNNGQKYLYMPTNSAMVTNSDWVTEWTIDKNQNYLLRFDTCPFPTNNISDFDLDLFLGSTSGSLLFNFNTGTPNNPLWGMAPVTLNLGGMPYGQAIAPFFGDIDTDGDHDLIVGLLGVNPCFKFWRNVGSASAPIFSREDANPMLTALSYSANATPCFADLNGDGLLDLCSGYQSGYFMYNLNEGSEMSPSWGTAAYLTDSNSATIDIGDYSAPGLVDIDGDGDLDLFTGNNSGYLWYYRNNKAETGASTWKYGYVTNRYFDHTHGAETRLVPRFSDINADGLMDLFVGTFEGTGIYFYQNTGTVNNALWAPPVTNYSGAAVAGRPIPAVTMNLWGPPINAASYWCNHASYLRGQPLSYEAGVASNSIIALKSMEVGYPSMAYYRSRPFDTKNASPVYNQLKWTAIETGVGTTPAGGDVDIRVRASSSPNMDDATIQADPDQGWTQAKATDSGFFDDGTAANSLAGLPDERYLQYEARFLCGFGGATNAHTNLPVAVLRDLTVDWPATTALADLQTTLGNGPDCAIVRASVNGYTLVKGIEVDMTIYKKGRTGTNEATGILEIKPLNTGR
ncbi:MAG: hypothetical protein C0404_11520 [Verrucomicrobia bacterium]|nr:hypothetical protein [Verrucomicrobiota bacterium]